jgi:hypothetical protein
MNKQEKHDYLITLIKELEKAGNETNLNNFIIVLEDTLKVKYRLRNYFDYPISAADYDELITYAENLLGVNRMGSKDDPHYETLEGIKYDNKAPAIETYSCFCINGVEVGSYHYDEHKGHYEFYDSNNQVLATIKSEPIQIFTIHGNESWNKLASLFGDAECCVIPSSGRTNDATSVDSAKSIDEKLNNMMAYRDDLVTDALVDYALIDMKTAEHILNNYTPDQLTIDVVRQASEMNLPVDGMKINKQTADYIAAKIKELQEDHWQPNAETIAALEEAMNEDPKNFKTWDEVKKEFFGDKGNSNYQHYWGKGQDVHWFYDGDFIDVWKCADIWHKQIYYWPYNAQIIVGQVNPVEWYKTKGDELEWGPIFGPFENPDQLSAWIQGFWKWWHRLSDENKVVYHNIPNVDNKWSMWNTNYIEMFRQYAGTNEYDYHKIAAEAQNDEYSKMTEEDYMKRYYNAPPKAFTKEWNERVAAFIANIKSIESNLEERDNEFDGEIIQDLERKLLDLLKQTL